MPPEPDSKTGALAAVAAALAEAPKYRHICPQALERVALWSLHRSRDEGDALRRAKKKLHQVTGAFLDKAGFKGLAKLTDPLPREKEQMEHACRRVLDLHASTRERGALMDELYPALWRRTGAPAAVLDLACGLHPFGLARMGLPREVTYLAHDLDGRIAAAVGRLFEAVGQRGEARCADLLSAVPDTPADVAFLLKTATSLEAQEKGSLGRVLSALRARWAVVSFPLRSLGGRSKGMEERYPAFMDEVLMAGGWEHETLAYASEVFYVVSLAGES